MIRVEVPEQGARDAHERPVGALDLAALDDGEGGLVDDDLVKTGLDETARYVLDLLASLDEQVVPGGDLDGDAGARVAGPNMQARVPRAAVDGEEVEVGVEAGEDGVLGAVLDEVGGGGGEEVRAGLGVGTYALGKKRGDCRLLTRMCRRRKRRLGGDRDRGRSFRRAWRRYGRCE